MKVKELYNIVSMAINSYKEFPKGIKLSDMDRALTNDEVIALSYYSSVLKYLSSKGIDLKGLDEFGFIQEDSNPNHEDYDL
jgi:hypothetical protein